MKILLPPAAVAHDCHLGSPIVLLEAAGLESISLSLCHCGVAVVYLAYLSSVTVITRKKYL